METTDMQNAIKKASEQYMRDFKRNITEKISQIKATIEQSQNALR